MDDYMKSFMEKDKYAAMLGIKLIESETGYAKCSLEIKDIHKNGLGSLHGAVIFSLADVAFAAACNREYPSIGMEAEIKYMNRAKGKIIFAEAKEVSKSSRVAHYKVEIYDELGTKVAGFTSMSYRLKVLEN